MNRAGVRAPCGSKANLSWNDSRLPILVAQRHVPRVATYEAVAKLAGYCCLGRPTASSPYNRIVFVVAPGHANFAIASKRVDVQTSIVAGHTMQSLAHC